MSAGFTPLRSVLGCSEQVHGWVKKFIRSSEKGLCKGLTSGFTTRDPSKDNTTTRDNASKDMDRRAPCS